MSHQFIEKMMETLINQWEAAVLISEQPCQHQALCCYQISNDTLRQIKKTYLAAVTDVLVANSAERAASF